MVVTPPETLIGECIVERTPYDGLRVVRADPVIRISLQLIQQANRGLRVDADTIVICGEVRYRPETVGGNGYWLVCRRVD